MKRISATSGTVGNPDERHTEIFAQAPTYELVNRIVSLAN